MIMRKIGKDEFIKRAIKIHGDKYDYSKAVYVNFDTKVEIICKEHGSFWQTPGNHLKGKGCPICSGNAKMSKDTFIEKAKKIWGDRFDYSLVEYKNNITKVCIVDSDGKKYFQTPANHLSGFDCTINPKLTTEEFVNRAKKIHGEKYNYDKTIYTKAKDKVLITCPIHGDFFQLPHNHIGGSGCPKCKQKSILETSVQEILDRNKIEYESEKRFKWLGKKSIDFFIPKLNIGIECQGKEHLYETGQWESFEVVLSRDVEKYNICNKNGIKLIYIIPNKEKRCPDFYNGKVVIKLRDFETYIKKEDEK